MNTRFIPYPGRYRDAAMDSTRPVDHADWSLALPPSGAVRVITSDGVLLGWRVGGHE